MTHKIKLDICIMLIVSYLNFYISSAVTVALKQVASADFKEYQQQVLNNARTLSKELQAKGYKVVTGNK